MNLLFRDAPELRELRKAARKAARLCRGIDVIAIVDLDKDRRPRPGPVL